MAQALDQTVQVYEVFIRTTPEALWQAITDPAFTRRYFFGTAVASSYRPGEPIAYTFPDGKPAMEGTIVESEPPRRLVYTWSFKYDEAMAREQSRVTWLIEQRGAACKLTATHELEAAPATAKHVAEDGWTQVLSGLKTLVETGEPLMIGQPGQSGQPGG